MRLSDRNPGPPRTAARGLALAAALLAAAATAAPAGQPFPDSAEKLFAGWLKKRNGRTASVLVTRCSGAVLATRDLFDKASNIPAPQGLHAAAASIEASLDARGREHVEGARKIYWQGIQDDWSTGGNIFPAWLQQELHACNVFGKRLNARRKP